MTEDELQMVSKYWYVFFAEPDSAHAYVLFLNQEWFSKEDVIRWRKPLNFSCANKIFLKFIVTFLAFQRLTK